MLLGSPRMAHRERGPGKPQADISTSATLLSWSPHTAGLVQQALLNLQDRESMNAGNGLKLLHIFEVAYYTAAGQLRCSFNVHISGRNSPH